MSDDEITYQRIKNMGPSYFDELFASIRDKQPDQAYSILAAIRGPDLCPMPETDANALGACKSTITTRIRAVVWPVTIRARATDSWVWRNICDVPLERRGLVVLADRIRPLAEQGTAIKYAHYFDHLRSAIYATRDHEIWGGLGAELFRGLDALQSRATFDSWYRELMAQDQHKS